VGRAVFWISLVLFTLLVEKPVRAEVPLKAALDWKVTPGAEPCADQPSLEHAVNERLERNAFVAPTDADLLIDGVVTPTGHGYHVVLRTRTRDREPIGQRELESDSDDCSTLDDDVSLVIALVIEAPQTRSRLRARPARSSTGWQGEIEPSFAAAYGFLPGIAFGPRLAAHLKPPPTPELVFDFTAYFPTEADAGETGVRLVAWQAGAYLCPALVDVPSVKLAGCGGIAAGLVQASGIGLDLAKQTTRTVVSVAGNAQLGIVLMRHLLLRPTLGIAVPITRYRFTYTAADGSEREIHRASPVAVLGSLGLSVAIP